MGYIEHRRQTSEIVDDCAAFLSGRLAERLVSRAGGVPRWMWTNLLAHGNEDDLRSDSRAEPDDGRADQPWRQARSYLAAEVLDVAERYGPLAELQRRVLIPLESMFASRPEMLGSDPRRFVATVHDALVRDAHAQRRSLVTKGSAR